MLGHELLHFDNIRVLNLGLMQQNPPIIKYDNEVKDDQKEYPLLVLVGEDILFISRIALCYFAFSL